MRPPHTLSVAPMLDRTDRHFRYLARLLSRRTLLYGEMVVADAILHQDAAGRDRLLGFDEREHPVAAQLGGDDPRKLAEAARIAADLGYDEINLNVGCPSERVQSGCFGVVLMAEPERVAEMVSAMAAATAGVPVTVKHRIGFDQLDRYEDMARFVDIVHRQGRVETFIVHARKAWLHGVSPKKNRTVPPLRYEEVFRLARERPELTIVLNGGVLDLASATAHLATVDGVMIGRAAYDDPWLLARADREVFGDAHAESPDPDEVVGELVAYAHRQVARGVPLRAVARHAFGLVAGRPGARRFRRTLSEGLTGGAGTPELIAAAWRATRDPAGPDEVPRHQAAG